MAPAVLYAGAMMRATAPTTLRCPTCGAQLAWRDQPVIECDYCHHQVPNQAALLVAAVARSTSAARPGRWIAGAVALGVIGVVAATAGRSTATTRTTTVVSHTSIQHSATTTTSIAVTASRPAAPAAPPPLGRLVRTIGEAGANAGQLTDARALAVTPAGEVVVAESRTGRVQVFDRAGAYQRLITLPPSALTKELTVFGAGAGPDGQVVVSRAGDLLVLDVAGGKVARTVRGSYPELFFHGDVEVVPDGSIHAITDRTGDLDVVHVSAAGKVVGKVGNVGAEALAVDGLGTLYLTRRFDDVIEVRDGKGAVTRKFSQGNPARGKLSNPGPIAIDGKGHLFVGEHTRVVVFDVEGAFLGELEVGAIQDLAVDRAGALYVLARDKVSVYELALPR